MTIRNENYIIILGFMINDLKLSGNNLLVYAIIYGITQYGDSYCKESISSLAEWCNCSKQGIEKNLKYLIDNNLIIKKCEIIGGVKQCYYKCNIDLIGIQQSCIGIQQSCIPPKEKEKKESNKENKDKENNIYIKNKENIYLKEKEKEPLMLYENQKEKNPYSAEKEKKVARFVKPTIEEVSAYCKERNNDVDSNKWFDFYESKGWLIGKTPMKDWKAAVRTWERSISQNPKQETKLQEW